MGLRPRKELVKLAKRAGRNEIERPRDLLGQMTSIRPVEDRSTFRIWRSLQNLGKKCAFLQRLTRSA